MSKLFSWILVHYYTPKCCKNPSIRIDKSEEAVKTQIRLLLKEQSGNGLHKFVPQEVPHCLYVFREHMH